MLPDSVPSLAKMLFKLSASVRWYQHLPWILASSLTKNRRHLGGRDFPVLACRAALNCGFI